ncbi:DUF3667 domain-containing protein [Echinicola rosea]|uniref:Putative zinc-ribbon domain-containing protein n=1 Tax=Echinicola rosea TaxID=1807691 RepID=A0ABQ1UIS9_9BACT|nr:DUF3667 domain-containing protein [Echinicola rosea]GGF20074.1 hypothetical protein GCM10011339_05080 [Echinicola rosea]
MKGNRKTNSCLNCGQELSKDNNFCPNCGQENKDQSVPFWVFLSDFFANYLNFESVFFRTIPTFLLKPGKLTQEFNAGKRRKYLHPIRLYLILSLFYFFAVGMIIPADIFDKVMVNKFSGDATSELIQKNLSPSLSSAERQELDSLIKTHQIDSLRAQFRLFSGHENDSSTTWMQLKTAAQNPNLADSTFGTFLRKTDYMIFSELDTDLQRNFIANSNLYIINSAQNLPIMMFVLLPFFALVLLGLYIKKETYYVEHLICGLHVHSFAYLIYGSGLLLFNFDIVNTGWIIISCFVLVTSYAYFSLLRLHQQGWLLTLVKFWALGFVYFSALFLAIGIELYISLLLL